MVRCMANNYSTLGFWRSWHRSYNLWIIRCVFGVFSEKFSLHFVFSFPSPGVRAFFISDSWDWLRRPRALFASLASSWRVVKMCRTGKFWMVLPWWSFYGYPRTWEDRRRQDRQARHDLSTFFLNHIYSHFLLFLYWFFTENHLYMAEIHFWIEAIEEFMHLPWIFLASLHIIKSKSDPLRYSCIGTFTFRLEEPNGPSSIRLWCFRSLRSGMIWRSDFLRGVGSSVCLSCLRCLGGGSCLRPRYVIFSSSFHSFVISFSFSCGSGFGSAWVKVCVFSTSYSQWVGCRRSFTFA